MMQTLLTPTSPPIGGDKRTAPGLAGPADGAVLDGDKADFAELMSQYRHGGDAAPVKTHAREGEIPQAAADTQGEPGSLPAVAGRQETDAAQVVSEGQADDDDGPTPGLPRDDASAIMAGNPFLVHLHDSLKQDTRLVAPGESASSGDGNSLPPGAEIPAAKGAAQAVGVSNEPKSHGQDEGADEAVKQTQGGKERQGAKETLASALLAAAGDHEALAGEGDETVDADPATRPGGAMTTAPVTDKGAEQSNPRDPLPGMGPKAGPDGAVSTPADAYAAGNRLARQSDQGQPAADGEQALTQTEAAPRQETAGKERAAPQMAAQAPAASGTQPAVAPTLVAPQQVLAQAQSQGSQAPLASLPQGGAAAAIDGAATQTQKGSPLGARGRLASLTRGEVQAAADPKREEEAQGAGQQPTQAAVGDARTGTVATGQPRAEAASLPHLKLASQDAPAELQQRVNVMLADKLQQAEIQLDPLGLGKMKIQIQLGQDNQASVNFVVQHGQTREMLEQAMPRLREMLAGQGLSLGQTSVQQQSQQHSQPGSQQQAQGGGFSEQGGQGQGGEGRQPGRHEGETGVTRLTLSMDAANESGIDFYA
ncbi:flagellar hook-length control protein FliK [Aeromonas bivalvium]|uniref:flagellar hook-length control protein FliK n=1 Tax=Aeromonas bivalvium TaxID=440079 RepID=UPI0038D1032B